jgi:DNA mismatch endonuclease (patch repair protein)
VPRRPELPPNPATRQSMLGNVRRDTKPELAVRRALHARGLRYRVDFPIRTDGRSVRPDVVFTRARVAVFVDGCFWHGCPLHATYPKRNAEYWIPKLRANRKRDEAANERLVAAGWTVLRFWEHSSPEAIADAVQAAVAGYPSAASRMMRPP